MALSEMERFYGPILLGIVMNIFLYGIMTTQTYYYYVHYKRDKVWMKCFVGLLLLADTLNTCFDVVFLYKRLIVYGSGSPVLWTADWIFNTDPAMVAIIAFFVQSFFSWRVKVVTGSIWIALPILFCSFAQLCGGLGTAIACGIVKDFAQFHKFKIVVIIWHMFAAVADVIIAAALVTHLRSHKTGFANTDDIITKLSRLAVSTGALTAVCAILDLVAFLASSSGLYLAINFPLAKLYTNSLLSSLNARPSAMYSYSSTELTQGRSYGDSMHDTRLTTVLGPVGGVDFTDARSLDTDSESPAFHMPNMFKSEMHDKDTEP